MKSQEKRNLIILGIISIVIIIILVNVRDKSNEKSKQQNEEPYVQVLEDGTKLNTSNKLNTDRQLDQFQISNIQLTNQNGQTVLLANITNTSQTATEVTPVDIIILDQNGETLTSIIGVISPLKPGQSTQLNTGITSDYANAYDIQIVKKGT